MVPAFFGLGTLWQRDAPWASAVETIVAPLDGHPVLERLEANRVAQLLARQGQARELQNLRDNNARLQRRIERQEALLRTMLDSNAFALAERLSALRQRGRPLFSRDDVERALRE